MIDLDLKSTPAMAGPPSAPSKRPLALAMSGRSGFLLREAAGAGNVDAVVKQLSGLEGVDVDDAGDVRTLRRPTSRKTRAWCPAAPLPLTLPPCGVGSVGAVEAHGPPLRVAPRAGRGGPDPSRAGGQRQRLHQGERNAAPLGGSGRQTRCGGRKRAAQG
jgi:hypothetical protein